MTATRTLPAIAEVEPIVDAYLDALYTSDAALLATVFHPAALYITSNDDGVLHRDMATYLPVVAARTSPAASGQERQDRLVSVTRVAPTVAIAVVECTLSGIDYTDALTLLHADGRWQIVAKVFHGQTRTA